MSAQDVDRPDRVEHRGHLLVAHFALRLEWCRHASPGKSNANAVDGDGLPVDVSQTIGKGRFEMSRPVDIAVDDIAGCTLKHLGHIVVLQGNCLADRPAHLVNVVADCRCP